MSADVQYEDETIDAATNVALFLCDTINQKYRISPTSTTPVEHVVLGAIGLLKLLLDNVDEENRLVFINIAKLGLEDMGKGTLQ